MADKSPDDKKNAVKPAPEGENLLAAGPTPEKTEVKPKRKSGGKLLFLLVGIVVFAFVIVLVGTEYFAKRGSDGSDSSSSSGISVGGPFELTNNKGETVTDKTFLGGYMMLFFGYTYCPDVCPTALSDIGTALDMLGDEKASKVTPVMISVDPARDTPDHLAEYVTYFHPRTVGLTGTEEQIKAVARAYRVYYKVNKPTVDDPLDYLVDHTSIIYLVGPDGKLVTHFSHGTTPEAMAERLGQLL